MKILGAREGFWDAVPKFMEALKAAVERDYRSWSPAAGAPPALSWEEGGRYIRIVSADGSSRAAFGFLDKTTGDVLKAAGWKAPAKNFARGNIFDDKLGCGRVRWTGIE